MESAPNAGAPAPLESDECHLNEELDALFGARENAAELEATFRARLLPTNEAARRGRPLAHRVVTLIEGRRFRELASLINPERGLCLRAAKGAECRTLSRAELIECGSSPTQERWAVDTAADERPLLTCSRAFERIFFVRGFRSPDAVTFNCFPPLGRANNGSTILQQPASVYVELRLNERENSSGGDEGRFRALWLVFDGPPDALEWVEITAEYPGMQRDVRIRGSSAPCLHRDPSVCHEDYGT
ncbi:MAG TPA: hypothetical protein VFQ61_26465 [Polyangiaceae bacterium]|nr:hypothetical protein [Polyangiaceae bacterium]